MSSNDASRSWAEKHGGVLQRLSPAAGEVGRKLALADRNLERARRALADGDPDAAIITAEAAIVNAADAVLARDGLRLRGKTGSHEARSDYRGLPAEFAEEARVIRAARRARNTALYDEADRVPESMAADAIRAAERLTEAARHATTGPGSSNSRP